MIGRWMIRVLLGSVSLALAIPLEGQVRDHRIEVSKAPSRKEIVSTAVARRATAVGSTIDWLGYQQAPGRLRVPTAGNTTLLADDIAFAGGSYRLGSPARLALVGSVLRVSGDVRFDLSAGRGGGHGGSLVILAQKLVCAPGARWTIVSEGGDARNRSGLAGRGGTLTFAVDEVVADTAPQVQSRHRPFHGAASPRTGMRLRSVLPGNRPPPSKTDTVACITFTSTGGKTSGPGPGRHGARGRLVRYDSRAKAGAADEELSRSLSQWGLEILQRTWSGVLQSDAAEDYEGLVKLFQRYASFELPVAGSPAIDKVRAGLNRYRNEVLLPVYPRPIEVQLAGVSHRLHVFTESSPLRSSLAPTHTLSVSTTIDGRQVLGLMEFDPDRPDEMAIEFEIELTLDPWLAALAVGKLQASGDSIAGMFTGWELKPRAHDELGVKESRIIALPGGRRMRVRLVVEGEKAGAVFWRLLSGGGIPLTLDWKYSGRPGQVAAEGTWVGPSLSLARRASHAVRFAQGRLGNAGAIAVSVEYLGLGSNDYVGLARALRLDAGESVSVDSIGLPPGTRTDSIWIPPQAVLTALDPLEVERSFHVINGQGFINHLTVSNLLPTVDESLGGALEYVEVFISIGSGSEPKGTDVRAGPYRLSAAHTNGSEINLPFLRQGRRQQVTVWGAAHYENGSCQTIASTTVESSSVKITPAMLSRRREAGAEGQQGTCEPTTVTGLSHIPEDATP